LAAGTTVLVRLFFLFARLFFWRGRRGPFVDYGYRGSGAWAILAERDRAARSPTTSNSGKPHERPIGIATILDMPKLLDAVSIR